MQEKTKNYLIDLIEDAFLDVSTIESTLDDFKKNLKKMKTFHEKVIKRL
jgi:hypothetical protein